MGPEVLDRDVEFRLEVCLLGLHCVGTSEAVEDGSRPEVLWWLGTHREACTKFIQYRGSSLQIWTWSSFKPVSFSRRREFQFCSIALRKLMRKLE